MGEVGMELIIQLSWTILIKQSSDFVVRSLLIIVGEYISLTTEIMN